MNRVWQIGLILFCFIYSGQGQISGLEGWDIFLDPGHSQYENMGIYSYSEAEKNVRVGLQLRDLLLSTTDIDTVYMSRTNDQQVVDLYERSQMANALGASWFHSIHSNAGAPEANSTLLLWGQYYNGAEKIPNGGKAMSDIMVDILTRGMRTYTIGSIGDCSFYTWSTWCQQSGGPYLSVNRNTTMPSELSEAGFHTNPDQNQLNMNREWKRLEAYTFYWSILKFHGIERPPVGIVTGIVSDIESNVPINGALVSINGYTDTTDTYESLFHKYTTDPNLLHNGFYFIEGLSDSEFEMTVMAPGFYPDTLSVTVIDSFFTFQDVKLISTIAPIIIFTTPVEGDTNYSAYNDIVIDFSRPMDTTSVQSAFNLLPATTGTFIWSRNDTRLQFIPDSLAYLSDHTLTIQAEAKDIYGHPLDGNGDGTGGDAFILNFRTGPFDIFPPEIVNTYPAVNDTGMTLDPIISITYDEPLNPFSIKDELFNLVRVSGLSHVSGNLKHYVTNNQSVLNFFPNTFLETDNAYRIILLPGFEDKLGNRINSIRYILFSTGIYEYPSLYIDNFEGNNIGNNWWEPQASGSTTGIITDSTDKAADNTIVNLLTGSTTSMKITYGWDPNASDCLIRVYMSGASPRAIHFTKNYILQAYVFGDGSGNKFRFAVDDHVPTDPPPAAYHEVSPWYSIDWLGWKLINWDMERDGTGSWLGDGNLDGTLRFDSFQLSYQPRNSVYGTIYIDDLRIVQRIISSIDWVDNTVPKAFFLKQNYPNPFNPVTKIEYGLPQACQVRMDVFDLTGKRCMTLINDTQDAGIHYIELQGGNLASGVYIYTLSAGGAKLSRKMILIK